MMTAQTVMAEFGLGGRFWFKAASAGNDARNVKFKERIGKAMYGEKRDVSDFRAFGCRASVYLDKAAPRKRKAHAKSQGGNIRWFRQQHERVGIMDSGR